MSFIFRFANRLDERGCDLLSAVLVWLLHAITEHRRRLPTTLRRARGSLRRIITQWKVLTGHAEPVFFPRFRRGGNRTPEHVEREVVRLHIEQKHLHAGQLALLLERVSGIHLSRETVRKILGRRHDLIDGIKLERKKPKLKIHVSGPRRLWGIDLTLVWILGTFPAWVLGIIDYHGSRLTALERVRWPNTAEVIRVFDRAVLEHGAPARLLSDNGAVFKSLAFELMLCRHDIDHTFTKPRHPWTNGRIERLFRTFKETIFTGRWLITSTAQLDRFCKDFLTFYNRDRFHSAFDGRTPDEVYFARPKRKRPLGRVTYFDGALNWYRFG